MKEEKNQPKKEPPKFSFTQDETKLIYQALAKDEDIAMAQRVFNGQAKLKLALDIEKGLQQLNKPMEQPTLEEEDTTSEAEDVPEEVEGYEE